MKLRHVLFALVAGAMALAFLITGIVAFEENTGKISAHFDAKEQRARELLQPLVDSAFQNPKLLDVTGPIKTAVRTRWSRHSSPFSETAAFDYQVNGEKADATLEIAFEYYGDKWIVKKYTVTPSPERMKESTWTENPLWNSDPHVVMEEEMKQLERDMENLDDPDPPEPADAETSGAVVLNGDGGTRE